MAGKYCKESFAMTLGELCLLNSGVVEIVANKGRCDTYPGRYLEAVH
jgi:hypothetical protein